MNECLGLGIYVDTARFVPANVLFKESNVTEERTVTCYEIVLFLKNGGYAVINGKKHPIMAGSMRFLRPGDRVYSHRFNEIYVVHFFVDCEQKGREMFAGIPSFINFPDIENETEIFKRMIKALLDKNDFECIAYLWSLLAELKRQGLALRENGGRKTAFPIKSYIDEHFAENITLSSLSEEFHIHPVYLQRKFKKEVGISPAEYLKRVRISRAKAYLLSDDLSIERISELTGFCNTSYFIRVFSEAVSLTPYQYRQKALLPNDFL